MKYEDLEMRFEKRKIWTYGYRPFVMGGRCDYVMAAEVVCIGPYDLGKGYRGWVARAPNGQDFVVEEATGAIVGPTLEEVRRDVELGDARVMKKQVAEAQAEVRKSEIVPVKRFWQAMRAT